MVITLNPVGGVVPKIKDPSMLPEGKSQLAVNCRFDQGGNLPLNTDLFVQAANDNLVRSLFIYTNNTTNYFFQWDTDVDAVSSPLPNDSWNRVFYTKDGQLRVTDNTIFNQGTGSLPQSSINPTPPAPEFTPSCSGTPTSGVISLTLKNQTSSESDGTYALIFTSLDSGSGAAGTYTVVSSVITAYNLTANGANYSIPPTVATQSGSGVIVPVLQDPTYLETKGYVYTYVNKYGEEGPPSNPSNQIDMFDGNPISVTNIGNQSQYQLFFNFGSIDPTGMRIFSFGGTAYAEVSSVQLSPNNGTFAQGNAAGALNLIGWSGVNFTVGPVYIQGPEGHSSVLQCCITTMEIPQTYTQDLSDYAITALNLYRINQTAGGAAQYQLVTQLPFSFTSYIDGTLDAGLAEVIPSTDWDQAPAGVTGLTELPNGVLAAFSGNLVCFTPPNAPHAWPTNYYQVTDYDVVGLSVYGTVVIVLTTGTPYVVVGNDPANMVMEQVEGLAAMSKLGIVQTPQYTIYPSPEGLSITRGADGEVITESLITSTDWVNDFNPTGMRGFYWEGKYLGFYSTGGPSIMFDPKTKDLVYLDFYATAGYYDEPTGTLYLVINNQIVAFNQGTSYRTVKWLSRLERYPVNVFKCAKIIAAKYPVSVDIQFPDIQAAFTLTANDDKPFRMGKWQTRCCQFSVYGSAEVSRIQVANLPEELA